MNSGCWLLQPWLDYSRYVHQLWLWVVSLSRISVSCIVGNIGRYREIGFVLGGVWEEEHIMRGSLKNMNEFEIDQTLVFEKHLLEGYTHTHTQIYVGEGIILNFYME